MLVYKILGDFWRTSLRVHKARSQDTIVHQMLVYKLLDDFFPRARSICHPAVDFKPGVQLIHGRHMHPKHERAASVPWKSTDLVRCIDLNFSRRAQCKASS